MTDRCEWPLTYGNCPTREQNGITYADTDAVVELAKGYIVEHAELMELLKDR